VPGQSLTLQVWIPVLKLIILLPWQVNLPGILFISLVFIRGDSMHIQTQDEIRPAPPPGAPLPKELETPTPEEQAEATPAVDLEPNEAKRILISLMVPSAMSASIFSMTQIATPAMRSDFQISEDMTAWIATAFTLPFMIMMPVYGRLGDGVSRRRLILISIGIFALGTVIALVAPNLAWLMAGRVIQGMGVAGVTPLAMAIISNVFPNEKNGKVLGTWSVVGPLTGFFAPLLAGFLIERWGWQTAFIPPLILAAVAFVVVLRKIPDNLSLDRPGFLKHFDWTGVGLLAAAVTALLCYLSSRPITGVEPLRDWRLLGGGLLLLGGVLWWEKRRPDPFIDLAIFSHKNFNLASLAGAMRMAVMAGLGFLTPLYLVDIYNLSLVYIGAIIMISAGVMAMIVRYGGTIADWWGSRWPCAGGVTIQISALISLFLIPAETPIWVVTLVLALHGLGAGLALAALQRAAMEEISETQKGLAAGLYNMSGFGGSAIGGAMGGVLLHIFLNQGMEPLEAYQYAFVLFAAVAAVGLITSTGLPHCWPEE
jgi:MFS family permease